MMYDIDNISVSSRTSSLVSSNSRQSLISSPLPSSSSLMVDKRRHVLRHSYSTSSLQTSSCSDFGEMAGGTAAECAAVICCCPCGLANLLYLTIYKLPTGLCRRALRRKRRQQLIKKGLLQPRSRRCHCGCDDTELHIHPSTNSSLDFDELLSVAKFDEESSVVEEEAMKLEKEMWETFYGTGFWRSPSQREPPPSSKRVSASVQREQPQSQSQQPKIK